MDLRLLKIDRIRELLMDKRILFLLFFTAICVAKENGLVVSKEKVWSKWPGQDNVKINVCWDPPGDVIKILDPQENNADLGMVNVASMKQQVETAVKNTWEKYAGIELNFIDDIPKACDIKVVVSEYDRPNSQVGKTFPGFTTINLNLTMFRYFNHDTDPKLGTTARARARQTWEAWRSDSQEKGLLKANLEKEIRYTAVHEFGHALGIYHEQGRAEAANLKEPKKEKAQPGSQPIGYYDLYSTMNYNSYTYGPKPDGTIEYRDRDGNLMPENPPLSCGDLIAIRSLYPPPDSKAALIPCCALERYKAIVTEQGKPLSWANFYASNKACIDGKGIKIGNLATLDCQALSKQAAGSDVCKSPSLGVTPYGDKLLQGSNYCEYLNNDRPEFRGMASMVWKNNMPHLKLAIKVPNLNYVSNKRVDAYAGLIREAGEKDFKPMSVFWQYDGGLDGNLSTPLNEITLYHPLGMGPYNAAKGCFCSYEAEPPKGSYAYYDPEKDMFLVDHSISTFRMKYRVINGAVKIFFQDNNCQIEDPNAQRNYFSLDEYVDFAVEGGNDFRLGSTWIGNAGNNPPGTPAISSLTTTDNGTGEISTAWSSVADADSDPIYYSVELRTQGTTEFKKYLAQGNTNLKITDLQRNTTYEVRVSAFDTKDRRYSEIMTIKTPDKPESCVQTNTEKVTLSGIPPSMLRRSISLYDYRQPEPGTSIFPYEGTFCVESDFGKFFFSNIENLNDIEQTDWLYIEAGMEPVHFYIYYINSEGNLESVSPGTSWGNNYLHSVGNLVRLADFWGSNAPKQGAFRFWPDANRVVKILVALKNQPSGRSTHRFGRLLVLKENPFGLNFKGFQVNGESVVDLPYRYLAYTGEPIALDILTWTSNASLSGGLMSSFPQSGSTYKTRLMAAAPSPALNTYAFSLTNKAFIFPDIADVKTGSFQLDVREKPVLEALVDDSFKNAVSMQEGKRYALRLTGILKPPRSILVNVNGSTQNVEYREGNYYFVPASLSGMNEISVILDGVELSPLKLRKFSSLSWLSLLLN
jgi:Fibronectin type III domain